MGILADSNRHRQWRMMAVIAAVIASIGLSVPGATSARTTPEGALSDVSLSPRAVNQADRPTLWTYEFNGHSKLGGANYTRNSRVFVVVNLYSGSVQFRRWVTSWQDHLFIAGGAIIVDMGLHAPCHGSPNGYARGYDSYTKRWSPGPPL
ncbi:hypothetical protein [Streptomyces sp. NPDC097610]|uniref:hypothetical protein n=1 Tax=Streptomyces sp. NPDC097610 TaxID=3157227 RepID=UPI003318CAC4